MKTTKTKISSLKTAEDILSAKYGAMGTPEREKFHNKALAGYYGDIFRDRRKELKLTQKQLAERINQPIAYVARVEKGEQNLDLWQLAKLMNELYMTISPVNEMPTTAN